MNRILFILLLCIIISLTDVAGQDTSLEDTYKSGSATLRVLYDKSNSSINQGLARYGVSKKIEIAPMLEIEEYDQDQGVWYLGVVFFVFIDNKNDPRFTYSGVGREENKEDAIDAIIQEWLVCFGNPFVYYLSASEPYSQIDDMIYYCGLKLVRGENRGLQFGEIENRVSELLYPYLKKTIYYLNGEPVKNPKTQTIHLKLSIAPNGRIAGECIWNGQSSPWMVTLMEEVEWPTTREGYYVKQYFIYTPKK